MSGSNGAAAEAKPNTLHRILIEFPDDHSISGIKIDVQGITPEQVMIAVYHLTRTANIITDQMQAQAFAAAQGLDGMGGRGDVDIAEVRRNLARGK